VPGSWAGITALGLLFGCSAGGPDGDAQAGVIGIGSALIGLFVTWFVARPVVVMDRTGVRLCPAFGSRTTFRWSEIASLGVGSVRRGRTRGIAFTVVGPDDEEASVDGAWLGLTAPALHRIDVTVRHFARSIGVTGPAVEEIVLDADDEARYH